MRRKLTRRLEQIFLIVENRVYWDTTSLAV
jgi:hypothetical protein